ncbi:unnamed protein product [Ranitomeya imitator]|uniref:Uncharacterized protein n=1 Tax=Ranitomeya imitator TaxID=111125 RepID=A0ABN9M9U4_9NEOB|nr:unnamed protein product [Ranitomeya imitator]
MATALLMDVVFEETEVTDLVLCNLLLASKRYYFELLHKQDDKGTDHVELAWRPSSVDSQFSLIDSQFLSLFSDDVNLPLGNTSLITIPLLPMKRVHSVLPSCQYRPSYLVEGYPLQRYQGLQFISSKRSECSRLLPVISHFRLPYEKRMFASHTCTLMTTHGSVTHGEGQRVHVPGEPAIQTQAEI